MNSAMGAVATRKKSLWITTLGSFDERSRLAWLLAASAALAMAAVGLGVSPHLSIALLGLSLVAVAGSMLLRFQFPRGVLTVWTLAVAAVWLSPLALLSPGAQRFVFAVAVLVVSLVYQGNRRFFPLLVALLLSVGSIGVGSFDLGRDLTGVDLNSILRTDSVSMFFVSLVLAAIIFSGRVAISHSLVFQTSLREATGRLERIKQQVTSSTEAVYLARERLWGRTYLERSREDEGFLDHPSGDIFPPLDLSTTPFDQLVMSLRKVFSDFQVEGRAQGRIAGPIRFVFFAPVAGYDGSAIVAADLEALVNGVTAFLNLALESLPEVGNRKREGVIRLSIRYGVRTIEIAVEDNGRGLASPNPRVEEEFRSIKELTLKWNGKIDRLARLGVGSRTAMELRLIGSSAPRRSSRALIAPEDLPEGALSSTLTSSLASIPVSDVPRA